MIENDTPGQIVISKPEINDKRSHFVKSLNILRNPNFPNSDKIEAKQEKEPIGHDSNEKSKQLSSKYKSLSEIKLEQDSFKKISKLKQVTEIEIPAQELISDPEIQGSKSNLEFNCCSFCSEDFESMLDLTKHINSVHESSNPRKCPHCNAFFTEKALTVHIKSLHILTDRRFPNNVKIKAEQKEKIIEPIVDEKFKELSKKDAREQSEIVLEQIPLKHSKKRKQELGFRQELIENPPTLKFGCKKCIGRYFIERASFCLGQVLGALGENF